MVYLALTDRLSTLEAIGKKAKSLKANKTERGAASDGELISALRVKFLTPVREKINEEAIGEEDLGSESVESDELYDEAVKVVREAKKASASILQRRLKIGYARAAGLLDLMESNGIVGMADGAKPREILED